MKMKLEELKINYRRKLNELNSKYQKNKRKILPLLLISVILLMWLFSIIQEKIQLNITLKEASHIDCLIEYGYSKCYEGKLYIPFYNPNERNITFVRISIPVKTGTNIYNVNESLIPKSSGVLPTIECRKDVNSKNFRLMWCCDDKCFKIKMDKPSKDVKILKK